MSTGATVERTPQRRAATLPPCGTAMPGPVANEAMAPRKHPVDDPPPSTPHPIAPVDEPKQHPEPPVEEPDDDQVPDT